MKKYMYLFRGGDEVMKELSPAEKQAHMQKWKTWMQALSKNGSLVDGLPLSREGKQLRSRGKVVTDGPFAEGKEIVGGYLIVNAEGLAGATEMAKGCPIFEANGMVEVREILSMD